MSSSKEKDSKACRLCGIAAETTFCALCEIVLHVALERPWAVRKALKLAKEIKR
jgi:hypothetical protein